MEKNLILIPATFIIVPGMMYMLLMPLGDASWVFSIGSAQKQMAFVTFEALTLLSAGALYSIWVAIRKYLDNDSIITFSTNPYIYVAIVIGIIISLASVVEFVYPNHYLKQVLGIREKTAFFALYVFGLPICIPAIHILILAKLNCANE